MDNLEKVYQKAVRGMQYIEDKPVFADVVSAAYREIFLPEWSKIKKPVEPVKPAPTILIIEDDLAQGCLFKKMFKNARKSLKLPKAHFKHAQTGEEALLILGSAEVQLVISDLHLYDICGKDLLNMIPPELPLIVMSASSPEVIKKHTSGFDNILKIIKKGQKLSAQDWVDIENVLTAAAQ